MAKPLPPWTKINKGDRRPKGLVLVSYNRKTPDFAHGGTFTEWGVEVAYWSSQTQRWVGKRYIDGEVTHYMPLPEPPDKEALGDETEGQ